MFVCFLYYLIKMIQIYLKFYTFWISKNWRWFLTRSSNKSKKNQSINLNKLNDCRVIMVGKSAVGKSAITLRFMYNEVQIQCIKFSLGFSLNCWTCLYVEFIKENLLKWNPLLKQLKYQNGKWPGRKFSLLI